MATRTFATATGDPELPLAHPGGIRFLSLLTESWAFKNFILLCIIINAITLGIDAHFGETNPWHAQIENLDVIFLTIFTVEIVLEFLAQGPRRYFRDGWNWFDLIVVGVSYAAMSPFVSALRTLRVFRVLRLVSNVPQMRKVVEALIKAMPGIMATVMVLFVVFYIGAVMATTLFGKTHGEFKDLGASSLTLFQLTQFDGWGDMVKSLNAVYPWAWVFILIFTIIAAFAVLNLFIGVIVDAVQEARATVTEEMSRDVKDIEEEVKEIEEDVGTIAERQTEANVELQHILTELRALRAEVAQLRAGRDGGYG
jgi:voltage-gated sodium channel